MLNTVILEKIGSMNDQEIIVALNEIQTIKNISFEEAQTLCQIIEPYYQSDNQDVASKTADVFEYLNSLHPQLRPKPILQTLNSQKFSTNLLKCKSCGGDLYFGQNIKVTYCKYCGSNSTISVSEKENSSITADWLYPSQIDDETFGKKLAIFFCDSINAPDDLLDHHKPEECNLSYVPFFYYNVHFNGVLSASIGYRKTKIVPRYNHSTKKYENREEEYTDWLPFSKEVLGDVGLYVPANKKLQEMPFADILNNLTNNKWDAKREKFKPELLGNSTWFEFDSNETKTFDRLGEQYLDSYVYSVERNNLPGDSNKDLAINYSYKYTSLKCFIPFYFFTYFYDKNKFVVLLNAAKGNIDGQRPEISSRFFYSLGIFLSFFIGGFYFIKSTGLKEDIELAICAIFFVLSLLAPYLYRNFVRNTKKTFPAMSNFERSLAIKKLSLLENVILIGCFLLAFGFSAFYMYEPTMSFDSNNVPYRVAATDSVESDILENALALMKENKRAQAIQILQPIADNGSLIAQLNLGVLYWIEKNGGEDSFKWFSMAADQGSLLGMQFAAHVSKENSPEKKKLIEKYKKLASADFKTWIEKAENGDIDALFFVASKFEENQQRDPVFLKVAAEFYNRCIDKGLFLALIRVQGDSRFVLSKSERINKFDFTGINVINDSANIFPPLVQGLLELNLENDKYTEDLIFLTQNFRTALKDIINVQNMTKDEFEKSEEFSKRKREAMEKARLEFESKIFSISMKLRSVSYDSDKEEFRGEWLYIGSPEGLFFLFEESPFEAYVTISQSNILHRLSSYDWCIANKIDLKNYPHSDATGGSTCNIFFAFKVPLEKAKAIKKGSLLARLKFSGKINYPFVTTATPGPFWEPFTEKHRITDFSVSGVQTTFRILGLELFDLERKATIFDSSSLAVFSEKPKSNNPTETVLSSSQNSISSPFDKMVTSPEELEIPKKTSIYDSTEELFYLSGDKVYLRKTPEILFNNKITLLSLNEEVTKLVEAEGKAGDQWVKIKTHSGQMGWIRDYFLNSNKVKLGKLIELENNIRSGPGINYELVGRPQKGTKIVLLEQNGKWWKIRYGNGNIGWTHKMNFKEID